MKTNSFIKQTFTMKRHLSWFAKATIQFTLFLVAMTGFILSGVAQTPVVVTNPASPWTVPAGVSSIKVEVWGGGGGGGGVSTGLNTTNGGGGGGGGAYNTNTLTVIPGQTYSITIGTAGTAGGSAANGGNGGATTVNGTGGAVTANGGTGGGGGNWGNGSAGAAGSGGFNNGGAGGASSGNGAGGGGGAGNATPTGTGNGGAGSNTAAGTAGLGSPNSIPYAGGIGAAAKTSNGAGNTGTAPGGGGGGGRASGWFSSNNGGAGAAGQVIITYTQCVTPSAPTTTNDYFCSGTSATLTASGAVSGEVYKWYDAAGGGTLLKTSTDYNDNTYTTLALTGTTNYWVSVFKAAGCESSRTQVTATLSSPVISFGTIKNISCNSGADGEIPVSASGGVAPYQFSIRTGDTDNWISGNQPDSHTFTGLIANTQYKIRVKDANNCESPIIP